MSGTSGMIGIVSVLGALILICGVAFLLLKLVQKMPGTIGNAGTGGSPLKMLRSLPVGQRERVTLVSYRGEVFMLGVSAGNVTLLARLDEEPIAEAAGSEPTPWLADRFRTAIQGARAQTAQAANESES